MISILQKAWINDFGVRVRRIRNGTGLSQAQFSDKYSLGGQDSVTRLERGVATGMSLCFTTGLTHVAISLGISLVWLFTGEGEMRPDPDSRDAISEDDLRLLNVMKAAKGVTITIPYNQEATS